MYIKPAKIVDKTKKKKKKKKKKKRIMLASIRIKLLSILKLPIVRCHN